MHKLRVVLRTCFKSTRTTADVCTSSARACKTSALRLFVLLLIYCWAPATILFVLFIGNVHCPYVKHGPCFNHIHKPIQMIISDKARHARFGGAPLLLLCLCGSTWPSTLLLLKLQLPLFVANQPRLSIKHCL